MQVERYWHMRAGVVAHLGKEDKVPYRRRLQEAYGNPDNSEATEELLSITADLDAANQNNGVNSMEEALTLQRLGMAEELGPSLRITNRIEKRNSTLGRMTRKCAVGATRRRSTSGWRWHSCMQDPN